jgi:hypothetical protein
VSPLIEEDSAFAKEAFSEITEMDIAKIDANEAVQKLIAFEGADVSSIEYGGVPIKFRVFLNKSLRHKMMRAKMQLDNAQGEDALNKTERLMYDVLGEVCTEYPWNDWKTWSRVDELAINSGGIQGVFVNIMDEIGRKSQDLKSFRRE